MILNATTGGDGDNINEKHERIAVYLKNDIVQKILIAELRFGGTVYTYANTGTLDAHDALSSIPGGTYDVWLTEDGITVIGQQAG